MRLIGRKDDQQPTLETVGTVVITYNQGRNGPNHIAVVRQADFDKLVNVINAYQEIVRLRGKLRAHPNEQVRRDMREALGLPHPRPKPLETRPFELQTYTVQPGRRRRPGRLRKGSVVTLSPWLMRSAVLTQQHQALPTPVES